MSYGSLSGQVAVITGGAQGIGLETAKVLAHYGATVVLADIKIEKAREEADKLIADNLSADAVQLNVISKESVDAMVKTVISKHKKIDILVNNAGIVDNTPIPELTVEAWDRLIDIDLRGVHLCSQACLPYMAEQKAGNIVNLSSQAGQLGGWLAGANYSAAKGGVIALTKAYARYGAKFNIRVNCVSPGFIATEMTQGRGDDASTVPLQRLGTALDVAKAVYFLASDLSDYITGSSVDVNGGFLMR
ncbi:MAG: SDR family NAD(P)-dependent oxidoreductase [Christensenellales bacterium]|jgi:3-oxoacyl-[acyl-carrier protein] reductase